MMTEEILLGVIGGSGLYSFEELENQESIEIDTPFGKPSSPIVIGKIKGQKIAFLARHGIGHVYSPTDVNYRANIYAFKSLGIRAIVSVSAVGSLREDYAPGHIIVPDQIYDNTKDRKRSFFGEGMVVHISSADPFCPALSQHLLKALREQDAIVHEGGTLITIEGPRFSTRGESETFRKWGMSLVGMTAAPEAFLAREAEMCYATMAHVTDFDCWHVSEEAVTVEMVVNTLQKNTRTAQKSIVRLVELLAEAQSAGKVSYCECEHALKDAIMTNPNAICEDKKQTLELLTGKYFK
ncbi:MAG TPA: S-methyl-5'-thioadenosine phosphorylase [Anaerolineaceae bacterium]|jgi:5'-methylthioadenosine phosphorylase|nr:S-methyl-5'-thioadenosine phosphorylase [Anaerolineaceae bacterium]